MREQAWKAVYDRYHTPEDRAKFDTAKTLLSGEDAGVYPTRWRDLVALEGATIAAGVAPGSDEGVALPEAWYELQKPMVEAVGTQTWNKASVMYQDMDQWRSRPPSRRPARRCTTMRWPRWRRLARGAGPA